MSASRASLRIVNFREAEFTGEISDFSERTRTKGFSRESFPLKAGIDKGSARESLSSVRAGPPSAQEILSENAQHFLPQIPYGLNHTPL